MQVLTLPNLSGKFVDKRYNSTGVATLTNTLLDAYSVVWSKLGAAKAPSPSDFAMKEVWPEHQKRSPILCLRPSTAIGLPLCVLWDGFRTFIVNTSDPNTIPSPAGRQAGASLCETMGDSFESEDERSSVIGASLEPVVPNWRSQYRVEPYAGIVLGQIDRVLPLCIVREDNWESTTTQSDIYMKTSRSYEILVQELRSKGTCPGYLAAGAPAFLMCFLGPILLVCGGFFDGERTIVEPLIDPVIMLRGHTMTKQRRLAVVLSVLHDRLSDITKLTNTPRLYQECKLIGSEEVAQLQFQTPLTKDAFGAVNRPIFLATLHRSSTFPSIEDVVVKMVAESYGADVHQLLAKEGLAPKLYAVSSKTGIPNAYVMERLPQQWVTLYSLAEDSPSDFEQYSQGILNKLKHVITVLKQQGYVHGDFRSNNIMINTNTLGDESKVDIKIVDFDWSGKAQVAHYPGSRNPNITWPGIPGGPVEQGDDEVLFRSWWQETVKDVRKKLMVY
ncbi:hypothetical protein H1R20_g6391, partial [Candolleomyces eurysporus]